MEPESSDTSAIIDAKEVRKFFPPRDDRRAVFDLLLPHLDAAATHIPIQELTPVLRRMILTERDYTTIIGLCLLVLVAHVYNDHIGTAEALLELTQILVAEYPKTEDPQKPTAPFWIYTIAWSLGNTPFTDIDREEALIVLSAYIKIVTLMETHFKSAVEASDDRVFRISLIGDSIIWSYELDLDIGRQALKNLIHIAIEEGDESQILRYCKHFPELMKYFALPRAALEVLYDCITILKDANYGNSMWWDKYWSEICKSLIKHGGEYKEHVESFIMRFDQGDIPDQIKNSLLSMSANEDISTEFAFAGLHLFRYAMKDPNPVMRDFIKEIGRLSLKHDKYENWLAECFLKVANIAYGDEFIPV